MKKEGMFAFLIALVILIALVTPTALAQSIDTGIKKITNSAEEYETGNINYAQLIVHTTSSSQELAEEMGATAEGHDAVLKAEQLEQSFGEPTEKTKWVWVEGEEREKKLDEEAPAWRKIIFDGKKIQIWLDAWPHIRYKDDKEFLFYRLHLDIRFKKSEEQININEKIEEIKELAENYKANPSRENLETLARESVNAEQLFNSNSHENSEKCEEEMQELFGSENKRGSQKFLREEIEFYEGDNFEAIFKLEMCDDCDWHGINLFMDLEIRQRVDYGYMGDLLESKERFIEFKTEDFKRETIELVENIRGRLEEGDYKGALEIVNELRILTDAWNEKANNVWGEVEDEFRIDFESMTDEEREECGRNYCWIKKEQERRVAERKLKDANYEERKNFYLDLFSDYEKKEFYYQQEEWEKRLVEEFREFGEEICDNNVDDNENQQIDCNEDQCGGKLCGYESIVIEENNQTREEKIELYCIAGTCQVKEEIIEEQQIICGNHICEEGEEAGEMACAEDCALCAGHEPIACEGNVIFSGKNKEGCFLEPICLEEKESCESDDDCTQLLCANVGCVEGICQVIELIECKEAECVDGTEKIQNCDDESQIVVEKCIGGIWKETDVECEEKEEISEFECVPCGNNCLPKEEIDRALCEETTEEFDCVELNGECVVSQLEIEIREEEIVGNECSVRTDCGNENDVCSNGRCVTIPEARDEGEVGDTGEVSEDERQDEKEEIEEREEGGEGETAEERIEERGDEEFGGERIDENEIEEEGRVEGNEEPALPPTTGNVVLGFLRNIAGKLKITGFAVEEGVTEGQGGEVQATNEIPPEQTETQTGEQTGEIQGQQPIEEIPRENVEEFREERDYERERENDGDRQREEQERRKRDCDDRCKRECYDGKIRPCTEDCIWKECGDELECNVDEVRVKCEDKCESDINLEICELECNDKCLAGEDTRIEQEREQHKQEKFVFNVGGSCRDAQGKTERFIWFGGWGEDFNDFHLIKNKYYSRGGGDWCEEDLENLVRQRRELEKSLNEDFAYWFFEKYVANSADEWEKHISGIFELYWRDVDISRQISETLQCLNRNELPSHELINFKYETDYGSVEFWEEIKTAKLSEEGGEVQIISPYMKTWLFPSREFFKSEMKRAMEKHKIPGPPEEEKSNTLSEEMKRELKEDEEFMEMLREFNEKYGENLVVQFKDFEKDEIAFNIYIKVNEEDIMYFEPMLPSEIPAEDVRIEFDVNKLLDIIEYGESGRIELESPPWDRKPREGFVKSAVGGVRMYFMFRSLMNSGVAYPDSAKDDALLFVRNFFEFAMGGGDERDREGEDDGEDVGDFEGFDEEEFDSEDFDGEIPEEWEDKEFLTGEVVRRS